MALLAAHSTNAAPVTHAEVRYRAHRAACSMHVNGGGPGLCEIGAVISAAVLNDLAGWLRDPTSGASQTVLDALQEQEAADPWQPPLTRAQAAADALAALLGGAS